ncbi:MAG: AI-2E family transporter [Bacillota bacterium]|nr:AI-2E family transporter [Bacillota bacterium]
MDFIKEILGKEGTKRIFVFALIILFLYLTRPVLNLFLLTFLFTYLIDSAQNFIVGHLERFIKVKQTIITIILYLLVVASIVLVVSKYAPIVIKQTIDIINEASEIDLTSNLGGFGQYLDTILNEANLSSYAKIGVDYAVQLATNIGKGSLNAFIALILSLFFMLEKHNIKRFMHKFETSKISTIYQYLAFYGRNFLNSFGKVIQAQILIALANTSLSVIALSFMGFPQMLAIGVMIFVLSLIPVAGVIISIVPLSLIAYKIGGVIKIVYVLVMVVVIHGIESYLLNPKLMSAKTKLPVFFTFVVLIVSEHFMGVWGLLLGIPLFMFVLDLMDVKIVDGSEIKKVR